MIIKPDKDKLFSQILFCISEGIIAINTDLDILFINPAAERMSGRSEKLAEGKKINNVFQFVDTRNLLPLIPGALPTSGRPNYFYDAVLRNTNGSTIVIDGCIARILDDTGALSGFIVVFRDISKIKQLSAAVIYHENFDVLTGLSNKESFYTRLEVLIANSKRLGIKNSLLYIDIDDFHLVKETGGLEATDNVLLEFSKILRKSISHQDIPSRLQGDDFAVILRDCSKDDAMHVAERILNAVKTFTFEYKNDKFKIKISMGIMPVTNESDVKTLIKETFELCHKAYKSGGNCVSSE